MFGNIRLNHNYQSANVKGCQSVGVAH